MFNIIIFLLITIVIKITTQINNERTPSPLGCPCKSPCGMYWFVVRNNTKLEWLLFFVFFDIFSDPSDELGSRKSHCFWRFQTSRVCFSDSAWNSHHFALIKIEKGWILVEFWKVTVFEGFRLRECVFWTQRETLIILHDSKVKKDWFWLSFEKSSFLKVSGFGSVFFELSVKRWSFAFSTT